MLSTGSSDPELGYNDEVFEQGLGPKDRVELTTESVPVTASELKLLKSGAVAIQISGIAEFKQENVSAPDTYTWCFLYQPAKAIKYRRCIPGSSGSWGGAW
jgi:hypothetical protein